MPTASKQPNLEEFLAMVNKKNHGPKDIRGFPGSTYKRISFNEKLGLYEFESGDVINGHNQGYSEFSNHYLAKNAFEKRIDELMNGKTVRFVEPGYYIFMNNKWDHSQASNDDSGSGFVSYGIILWQLHISSKSSPSPYRIGTYDITMTRQDFTDTLVDRDAEISPEKIEEAVRKLTMDRK